MKSLRMIAIATAVAIPALAAFSAGVALSVTSVAELGPRERGGIDNPRPWAAAELGPRERGGIDNPRPWAAA